MHRHTFLWLLLVGSLILNTMGVVRWNAGASYDTAHKGIETIEEVLQGNLEPFYRHYNGQPPFMDWFLAPLFLFVGVSPYTLHVMGVVMGVLTTLLLYMTGTVLWSRRAGVYASVFGTTSHWLLLETREGTHNIPLVPLLLAVVLCAALIWKAKTSRARYVAAFIGGICAGLMGYVYAAGWIFPLLFAVVFPMWTLISFVRSSFRRQVGPLLLMTVLMGLIWIPFVRFTIDDSQIVFMHADDEVRTREPFEIVMRVLRHVPPMIGAFTYIHIPPFSDWELNATLYWLGIPFGFPAPLVSPGGGLLLLIGVWLIARGRYKREAMIVPAILVAMLVVAVVPNLVTDGPQPHYRRAVCAIAPLFLLLGWAAAEIHRWIETKNMYWRQGWYVFIVLTVLYGPLLYFGLGIHSQWFAENYHTKHDRVAPLLFARVAAGQRVILVGNSAHLKSFQFYALATPQGQSAFYLYDRLPNLTISADVLDAYDVVLYIHPTCDVLRVPGFDEPMVLRSRFGIDGCIFDRPGVSAELKDARVKLPSSPPLLPAFLHTQPPLKVHEPFHGLIYGI